MRRGALLALVCACVVAIPAAVASTQAETVTLKVGETVPLKTVFDKTKTYRIVMSGLITMTLKEGNQTVVYDPFYGAQDANCTNSGATVNLQIKDAAGNLIDFAGAGKPPCRKDHRYEFLVNDSYPPGWELHGKATSYITLQPDPKFWTVGGSFTLRIEEVTSSAPSLAVQFKVLAKKEIIASRKDLYLADVRLRGAGSITVVRTLLGGSGRKEGYAKGSFTLTLVWLNRDDEVVVLRPHDGFWTYRPNTKTVGGWLEIVKSDVVSCFEDEHLAQVSLREDVARVVLKCAGLPLIEWEAPASSISASVKEVQKK